MESASAKSIKQWLITLFSGKNQDTSTLKEALAEVIEEHSDNTDSIDTEEQSILQNVLAMGELVLENVMIPRGDIFALKEDVTLEGLRRELISSEHTRVPIYRDNLDDITGFVHIKDLLPYLGSSKEFCIADVLRPILVVPPSMRVVDLLVKMRLSRVHIAQVVDEYGGTDGLVTLEDLFEEIVGEIHDEHDDNENAPHIHWSSEHIAEADARYEISHLEDILDIDISNGQEDEYHTIGGLVFTMLGEIPKSGESVVHDSGLRITVTSADARRIIGVRIDTSGINKVASEENENTP